VSHGALWGDAVGFGGVKFRLVWRRVSIWFDVASAPNQMEMVVWVSGLGAQTLRIATEGAAIRSFA